MRRSGRSLRARGLRRPRRRAALAGLAALLAATAGCEDQVKWIPFFSTMTEQPSREAYEIPPFPPPEGTMPVDGERSYDLLVADTALSSPIDLARTENIARGQQAFTIFCTPCHGEGGEGDGPVVGPNRIPPTPLLNLLSERAAALSDGYLWGMITNGRGLMPSYRRIPPHERWYVVAYVRRLQRAGPPETPASPPASPEEGAPPPSGGGETMGGARR